MKTFKFRAEEFLKSLIKQRMYLIKNGKSKNLDADQEAQFLNVHLRAYPNRSEKQMASFWMNNQERIFSIIPGPKSGSSETLIERFDLLQAEARIIYQSNLSRIKIHQHGINA